MAAGLGFKTFNTGDVLSAADTNGYLMQNVWVFADAAARTAAVTSPQEGNFSFLKDTNSTEYYDGAAWVAVGGGGGGGKVLQVVNFTLTTTAGATTTTFVDTGLTATITPSSATSKVLIFANIDIQKDNVNGSAGTRLLRASTVIATMTTQAGFTNNADFNNIGTSGITYLDEPATTSATTYKVQVNAGTGNSIGINSGGGRSSITLMEIGA
jgi:hypothetical protein